MYRYQVNLFENGAKILSKEQELSGVALYAQVGKVGRDAFLELINRWNRQGMIGFENHGKTWLYVALPV